jgi:hypothetical protein
MKRLATIMATASIILATQSLRAAAQTAASQEPHSYWLVVTGLSGEPDIATTYGEWSNQIARVARDRFGATRVLELSEAGPASATMSTRSNIERQLTDIAMHATPQDALFIILIGHGSASDNLPRIALPGPDLSAMDLARYLGTMPARVTVINTASTSGAWLVPLASKGRVVVTATKSGTEQNETTFAGYFAAALSSDAADTDKDNRVSVLEAFDYAKREVERAYAADKRMLTEHAQIDGDGDGKAVAAATTESPDGAVASLTFFSVTGSTSKTATAPQTPELRALYAAKTRLEEQLAALRTRKAEMPEAEYQKQLEPLLLEIAKNGQAIRKLEGGK